MVFEPGVYVEDAAGTVGWGDGLADALGAYLETLDFQRRTLERHDLTPGGKRRRDALEGILQAAGVP